MNPRLKQLIAEADAAGFREEMAEVLAKQYFANWMISGSAEERERIFVKCEMIDELLSELLSIIETIPRGEAE